MLKGEAWLELRLGLFVLEDLAAWQIVTAGNGLWRNF